MNNFYILLVLFFITSCHSYDQSSDYLPPVPQQAEAVSLLGEPLYSTEPSPELMARYKVARAANLREADNLIWFGRFTAYIGKYRDAILLYSQGFEKFPKDARFLRHRGHRYISIREFDRAISDFQRAAEMTEDQPDEIEPDGMPNSLNVPVSTLKSNIFYHLGLASYLNDDLENAEKAFRKCIALDTNDDNLVSTTHWLYMTLRLMGRKDRAEETLEEIQPQMNVIENMAYHQLCLLYSGSLEIDSLENKAFSQPMNEAIAYGIGNWYLVQGEPERAREIFEQILSTGNWAAFGYIAAEAAIARWEALMEPFLMTQTDSL
jgi:tetratricopeptide (TPR) repeat protein